MISNGKNGYYYDFDKPELLINVMEYAIVHVNETMEMKRNCLKKAVEYSENHVMKQIRREMEI